MYGRKTGSKYQKCTYIMFNYFITIVRAGNAVKHLDCDLIVILEDVYGYTVAV